LPNVGEREKHVPEKRGTESGPAAVREYVF